MEGRDSPGPFSESFCVPVAICGQKGLLTLGRRCRTWAREAGSTLAGCGGKAARRTDWPVGVGCMERAQLRTGRPKVAREVAEHSMDSQKAPFPSQIFCSATAPACLSLPPPRSRAPPDQLRRGPHRSSASASAPPRLTSVFLRFYNRFRLRAPALHPTRSTAAPPLLRLRATALCFRLPDLRARARTMGSTIG